MKIGDKVTYTIKGTTYNGTLVWLREFTGIVQTEDGIKKEVDLKNIFLI